MPNVTYHGNLPVQDIQPISQMEVWYYLLNTMKPTITALEMLAHNTNLSKR